jgi:phosphatidylserine decarboxylase
VRLAPEGVPFVIFGTVILAILGILAWKMGGTWLIAALLWVPIAIWIPAFFRDPVRDGPRGPDLVISPADGQIVSVIEVEEPDFMGGKALRISVFMNVFNVHVNRYPTDGEVQYRNYREGRFFNASLDKASTDNEQMSIGLATAHGSVLVRQIAGLVARRIIADHDSGHTAHQGDRLGIIRFGSRVDTFLPIGTDPRVQVGDKVKAGQTVLAEWK